MSTGWLTPSTFQLKMSKSSLTEVVSLSVTKKCYELCARPNLKSKVGCHNDGMAFPISLRTFCALSSLPMFYTFSYSYTTETNKINPGDMIASLTELLGQSRYAQGLKVIILGHDALCASCRDSAMWGSLAVVLGAYESVDGSDQ